MLLHKTLYNALKDDIWADRVYPEVAPAGTEYPYVVWYIIGGGEVNDRRIDDAVYIIGVKCISDSNATALTGQNRISQILNNRGSQDGGPLQGDAEWSITTVSRETVISVQSTWEGARPIYHRGHQYTIVMESK